MRRQNTKPTHIYWLVDARTNTPFYCGKTVESPKARLADHKQDAKRYPNRKSAQRVTECGEHIRIEIMTIIPAGGDWVAAEKRWIELLRFSFPGAVNVAAGGQGVPGCIPSAETREKMRAARIGKKRPPEIVAKIAASNRGKKHTARLGRKHSTETRAKISLSNIETKRARHV